MKPIPVVIALLCGGVAAAPPGMGPLRENQPCTPRPALYEDWKSKAVPAPATDSAARAVAELYRDRVRFDPFDAVIAADDDRRRQMGERVLWEDDSVLVLVAKPAMPRDALVIPRREMMFLYEASDRLRERLAMVAAAVSDAFIHTAGKPCERSLTSRIWVNPPQAIGVRHLHVHVQPPDALAFQDEAEFYARMSRRLEEVLSGRRSNGDR